MAAAATVLRGAAPLSRLRLSPRLGHGLHLQQQRPGVGVLLQLRRLWWAAAESNRLDEDASSSEKTNAVLRAREPARHATWDDPEYRKWRDKEEEILKDIEPIVRLCKEILHSNRYMDGECLTVKDEEAIVEKLLAYHPNSEDKIGCGLDSIMEFTYLCFLLLGQPIHCITNKMFMHPIESTKFSNSSYLNEYMFGLYCLWFFQHLFSHFFSSSSSYNLNCNLVMFAYVV